MMPDAEWFALLRDTPGLLAVLMLASLFMVLLALMLRAHGSSMRDRDAREERMVMSHVAIMERIESRHAQERTIECERYDVAAADLRRSLREITDAHRLSLAEMDASLRLMVEATQGIRIEVAEQTGIIEAISVFTRRTNGRTPT